MNQFFSFARRVKEYTRFLGKYVIGRPIKVYDGFFKHRSEL